MDIQEFKTKDIVPVVENAEDKQGIEATPDLLQVPVKKGKKKKGLKKRPKNE